MIAWDGWIIAIAEVNEADRPTVTGQVLLYSSLNGPWYQKCISSSPTPSTAGEANAHVHVSNDWREADASRVAVALVKLEEMLCRNKQAQPARLGTIGSVSGFRGASAMHVMRLNSCRRRVL